MTVEEINEWIKYLSSRSFTFANWYSGLSPEGELKSRDLVQQELKRVMHDVPLTMAKDAVDQIIDADETPRFGGEWIDVVRRWIRKAKNSVARGENSRELIDGQPTFSCKWCLGSGIASIVNPLSQEAAARGDEGVFTYAGVKCFCEAGVRLRFLSIVLDLDRCYPAAWVESWLYENVPPTGGRRRLERLSEFVGDWTRGWRPQQDNPYWKGET